MITLAITCMYNDNPEDKSGWHLVRGVDLQEAVAKVITHYGFMPSNPIKIIEG